MFLIECWNILCELAPWLLLGMLLSGVMHVLLPQDFIRQELKGASGVLKAVCLGVPLPLCSCGVVPAGIGLKNQGASNGAAVGFLISTPQTGVDSILVSASFFGWPFAIFKMVTAAITGLIGGWLADWVDAGTDQMSAEPNGHPVSAKSRNAGIFATLLEIWVHGLEIVRSIWVWLLIGILVSALIETAVPQSWIQGIGSRGLFPAMLLMLVVSIPLYVCATASVPIAAALVSSGIPPAAALVFLMAGPATNITTIGAIHSRFGWRTLVVYLSTISLGSMFFAWLFDWLLNANIVADAGFHHDHHQWWSVGSAIVLMSMMVFFIGEQLNRRLRTPLQGSDGRSLMEINIEGMTCGNCVSRLEKALQDSAGIVSVRVQLNPGLATIVGDVKRAEVDAIINGLGFRVVP